jgi:hypothetical protein
MDKQLKQIKEYSEKEARKTQFYKRLIQRTYRRINGYIDYKQVATDLATHFMCLDVAFELRGFSDSAWNAMSHSVFLAYENPHFPVFAITRELAEAFLATDLPPHVCDLSRSFYNALFLFPEVMRTPDDYLCQWAFTSHFLKGERIENLPKAILKNFSPEILSQAGRLKSPPLEVSKFRWVSQVGRVSTIYGSTIELPEESDRPIAGDIEFGGNLELWGESTDAATEQQFLRQVDKLLLQALLYLQLKPEAVSATPPSGQSGGSGFRGKGKPDPRQPLEPIWLGKDYQPRVIGRSHGSHASPRLHWRRGHWKRVPVGEGGRDRKWAWIEPTLINAD